MDYEEQLYGSYSNVMRPIRANGTIICGMSYIPSVQRKTTNMCSDMFVTIMSRWHQKSAKKHSHQLYLCVCLTCWSQYAVNIEDMLYKHFAHRKRRCIASASSNANWTCCWNHLLKFEVSTTVLPTHEGTQKKRETNVTNVGRRFPSCYHANRPKKWFFRWFSAVWTIGV